MTAPTDLIQFKTSAIHGTGGFATRDLPAETELIEYVGERIDKQESLARCEQGVPFIFHLDDEWDLDGDTPTNPARFLNHSCEPNCEALDVDGRIWIVSTRPIACGEEITFNYNYDMEDYQEHPCRCGAPGCVGFMVAEEFFDDLRARQLAQAGVQGKVHKG